MESYVTNKTVLVVDDEVDFCHMIRSVLGKQGFKVVLAHTLEFAKVQLTIHNPTIILLDHNMPDGLGTRFLQENKSALEHKHVIFITGDTSPAVKDEALKLGVFDFLPKPFHYSALNKVMYLAATFN
jgi:DNA-binding response OmpR family regulator